MSVGGEACRDLDAIVRETRRGHSHRTRVILSVGGEPSASGEAANVRRAGEASDLIIGGPPGRCLQTLRPGSAQLPGSRADLPEYQHAFPLARSTRLDRAFSLDRGCDVDETFRTHN
jgi:hypothetical protein